MKALGCERLKLKCDDMLSHVAFIFNLPRYMKADSISGVLKRLIPLLLVVNHLLAGAYTHPLLSSETV